MVSYLSFLELTIGDIGTSPLYVFTGWHFCEMRLTVGSFPLPTGLRRKMSLELLVVLFGLSL
jgi:hypothetical protein